MKKLELDVKVFGGTAPVDILVSLYKNKIFKEDFNSAISFIKKFDLLESGAYSLYVYGFNPAVSTAYTTLNISGVGITIISPKNLPLTKKGAGYWVHFKFTV